MEDIALVKPWGMCKEGERGEVRVSGSVRLSVTERVRVRISVSRGGKG
jgi:hypothetical protein